MITKLKTLSDMGGISGFEYTISPAIEAMLSPYCDRITTDRGGNVVGWIDAENPDAPTVMIEAHMDGIGLMVKDITDRGFLTFVPIGGIDPRICLPARLWFAAKKSCLA